MPVKVYRHPDTLDLKQADPANPVQIAALTKLGYKELTAADIEEEEKLSVTYQQVTPTNMPATPPALPHLTKPILPGPTRDTSPTAPKTALSTAPRNTTRATAEEEPAQK